MPRNKSTLVSKPVEPGQLIWVHFNGGFIRSMPSDVTLHKYRITRVNRTSFYAADADSTSEKPHEMRFDRRTWISSTGWGEKYKAWNDPQDFYDQRVKDEQRRQLVESVKQGLAGTVLSDAALHSILAIIEEERKRKK